jgi:hypothetical protein
MGTVGVEGTATEIAEVPELRGLPDDQGWRSAPIACSLDGSAMVDRLEDWHRLLDMAISTEAIPDGLRVGFPPDPDLAADLTRLAAAEQDCCTFFDFTLHLTPAAVVLSVRTPEAGREVLAELFGVAAG